jgi:hypothetical protein
MSDIPLLDWFAFKTGFAALSEVTGTSYAVRPCDEGFILAILGDDVDTIREYLTAGAALAAGEVFEREAKVL